MTRRQFAFWVSFGIFSLAEKFRFERLDRLAAATVNMAEPTADDAAAAAVSAATTAQAGATHWTAAQNRSWRWYERETFVDGKWKLTGITTPISRETGERYTGHTGYLDDLMVPADMRLRDPEINFERVEDPEDKDAPAPGIEGVHKPDVGRRARHGRPPSKWLRSLHAKELRVWLKKIDVPEAGVEGMTYWTHLTRDHFFDAEKIAGLSTGEQAKLHAAAHFGY